MRRILYVLSLLTVLWAGAAVPMPVLEIAPGEAPPIAPLVQIGGEQEVTTINGALHLLTVNFRAPSLAEVVRARFDDRRSLTSRSNVIPDDIEPDLYFEEQRRMFASSFDVAAAVGAQLAGFDAEVSTAPVVVNVIPTGPSDGVLQRGDIVREIDGMPVDTAQQLADRTGTFEMGTAIPLTIERGTQTIQVEVTAGQVSGMPRPGLGINISEVTLGVDLPFPVELGRTRIGGPSAGLMFALTVYDLLAEEDLADGRVVAGTGTINLDGTVGRISSIPEKVAAAEAVLAEIMLVPAGLEQQARDAVTTDMHIIGVRTIREAVEALRR